MSNVRKNEFATTMKQGLSSKKVPERTDNSISLSEQVYQILKKDIVTSVLPPGERVIENAIAREHGVSRTPVREALRRLIEDNLVKLVHRNHYVIAPITLRDIHEVFSLRGILEGEAAALATNLISPSVLDELESLLTRLLTLNLDNLDTNNRLEYVAANHQFHSTIAQASGHGRLIRQILQLMDEAIRFVYAETRLTRNEGIEESQLVIEAMRATDAELARQRMQDHIQGTYLRAKEAIMNEDVMGSIVVR